ncbi:hypothetical protein [Saccharopolyspora cebuensis]|uniref:hypothetical protein n=1 Tax=Saccharopolyspora cebuensis TaxID=418759 RepID=UPI0031EA3E7D
MGKGARARKKRATAATASPVPAGPYFHGGVPGKGPGDVLWPAQRLGFKFRYYAADAPYDPAWVYITADADVATGYASRFVNAHTSKEGHGDVYEVEPVDVPQSDPDYSVFPEVFLRCRSARITRVVATGVSLTRTEQNYLERRYEVWGDRNYPVFDENGHILPSEQMRANGVTREWTLLLRPWLGPREVDADGRLAIAARAANPWMSMLEAIPSLDRTCQVREHPVGSRSFQCTVCEHEPVGQHAAALHQLGEHPVRVLTRIYGWEQPPVPPLVQAARTRNPARWSWLN